MCEKFSDMNLFLRKNPSFTTIKYIITMVTDSIFNDRIKETLLTILKNQKITDSSYDHYEILKEFLRIIKEIHNILMFNNTYNFIKQHLNYTFVTLNKIMINSCDLN